jgi:hypothetical protein
MKEDDITSILTMKEMLIIPSSDVNEKKINDL